MCTKHQPTHIRWDLETFPNQNSIPFTSTHQGCSGEGWMQMEVGWGARWASAMVLTAFLPLLSATDRPPAACRCPHCSPCQGWRMLHLEKPWLSGGGELLSARKGNGSGGEGKRLYRVQGGVHSTMASRSRKVLLQLIQCRNCSKKDCHGVSLG